MSIRRRLLLAVPSRPEHLAGRLAPLRWTKEQIKEWNASSGACGLFGSVKLPYSAYFGSHGGSPLSRPVPANETADQFSSAHRWHLRDISSDQKASRSIREDIERPDEIGGVLRHRIDRVQESRRSTKRPRIIEQNDRPIFRKAVSDRGINDPFRLAYHEEKRRAAFPSEPAVERANPIGQRIAWGP